MNEGLVMGSLFLFKYFESNIDLIGENKYGGLEDVLEVGEPG